MYSTVQKFWGRNVAALLLPLKWNSVKVRDRYGGMVRFKCGMWSKGWVDSVTTSFCSTCMQVVLNY